MSKFQELLDVLNICISTNSRVCKQIANKRQEIADYRKKYLAAKTTGTTLGTIGAIGLVLAPFTAGTSLLVSLGAGVGGTLTGIGVNLITDIVNSKEMKEFIKDLNLFNASRNDHLQRFVQLMEELSEKIQAYVKQGTPLVDAIGLGLYEFGGGFTEWRQDDLKKFSMWTKMLQVCSVEGAMVKSVLFNAKLAEVFAKSLCLEIPALKLLDLANKGLNITKNVFKGLAVTATVIFVAIDVGLLIKDFVGQNEATGCAYRIEHRIEEQTKMMTSFQLELMKLMQMMKRNEIELSDTSSSDDDCICKPIKVSVLYCNIRSANPTSKNQAKLAKFRLMVASTRPQIVALVETWLTSQHSDSAVESALGLEGYIIFRNDRGGNRYPGTGYLTGEDEKRGGGMLVAWRNSP